MTEITERDWADYCYMMQLEANDTDDFRFVIEPLEEQELGATHWVGIYSWRTGALLESFTTDDPYGAVEAAREAQEFSLEERMTIEFEREMRDRQGGGF